MKVKAADGVVKQVTPSGELSQPHLLVYSEDERHVVTRAKRSPGPRNRRRQRGRRRGSKKKPCQLKNYYVDFKVLDGVRLT